jgi:hypothetical protein
MIVLLGLIILVTAVVVGVAAVLSNADTSHALGGHGFAVFGYHVTGSTGTVFLYGIVVGAIAVIGLGLLVAATRRMAHRGRNAREELKQARKETAAVSLDRDALRDERDAARAEGGARPQHPASAEDSQRDGQTGGPHLLGTWSRKKRVSAGTADR